MEKSRFKYISSQVFQAKEMIDSAQKLLQSELLNQDLARRERQYVNEHAKLRRYEEAGAK